MKKLAVFLVVYPVAALLALRIGAVPADLPSVAAFFTRVRPLVVVVTLAAGFSVASFLLGSITGDYSWVDRLWSTAPAVFAWVYAARAGYAAPVTVAALLVTLWAARLTYNFARRGGYTSMEDYRWPILRERIENPLLWQLFNLFFISGFQVALFVLFTLPVQRLAVASPSASAAELVLWSILFVAFLAFETVADQEQYTFQRVKHGEIRLDRAPAWFGPPDKRDGALEADIRRGFLTHGLFRLSRHPNYFGELAVWWSLYFLASGVTGDFVHWSGIGAVALTALFVGSTIFTESITASRYAAYADYQAVTSPIVPLPPGGPVEQHQPG